VPPVNIPLGATELGTSGLSPLPGAAAAALAPLGASTAGGISGFGSGLSPMPNAPSSGLANGGALGAVGSGTMP
jgi:hypothetical protein